MISVSGIKSYRLLRLCPCLPRAFSTNTTKELKNLNSTSWPLLAVREPAGKINAAFIPCLPRAFSFSAVKKLKNLNRTSWPSPRIRKPKGGIDTLFMTSLHMAKYSSKRCRPATNIPRYVKDLNVKLASLETTKQHLELFESVKTFASIGDKVCILFKIAKITGTDEKQKRFLEKEREKSQKGQSTTYVELLESISNGISECNARNLANLMWALGKIQESDHEVVKACEKEILLRGIAAFNTNRICQIVTGCSNVNLRSNVFVALEEAILNDKVKTEVFENRELSGILLSFAKTDNAFVEMFHLFLEEIISRDFSMIESRALAEIVWAFAKKDFKAEKLFLRVEEEILRRGVDDFDNAAFAKTLWAFGTAEKGSKHFFYFLDRVFVSRAVNTFDNSLLLEIVWSFTKRNVTQTKVFDVVETEIFKRGVHTFKVHQLVLILFSFVSAQRHNNLLVAEIEGELCARDVSKFTKGDLCQIAWSLGRAGKSESQLFDAIEAEILQRDAEALPSREDHWLMLMRGFIEANRGTNELYEFLARYFCRTDFRNLKESGICECAWCFTQVEIEVGDVFDSLEKEISKRNKYFFNDTQVAHLKTSFGKVGKGGKRLLNL